MLLCVCVRARDDRLAYKYRRSAWIDVNYYRFYYDISTSGNPPACPTCCPSLRAYVCFTAYYGERAGGGGTTDWRVIIVFYVVGRRLTDELWRRESRECPARIRRRKKRPFRRYTYKTSYRRVFRTRARDTHTHNIRARVRRPSGVNRVGSVCPRHFFPHFFFFFFVLDLSRFIFIGIVVCFTLLFLFCFRFFFSLSDAYSIPPYTPHDHIVVVVSDTPCLF